VGRHGRRGDLHQIHTRRNSYAARALGSGMVKFVIALLLVFAVVLGGLLAFRRSSRIAMPSQDVIDRVKVRERELEKLEKIERDS
jgi:hypothetical protein